jgi:carbamoyltransferase
MKGSYLGPDYSNEAIKNTLKKIGAIFIEYSDDDLINKTADFLSKGDAIGWFQGRMEFGPRALGGRSILGDPRSEKMQKNLNLKVKYRESFRPFAPSILAEDLTEWFEMNTHSPYMLLVANVNKNIKKEMTNEEKKLFGIDKLNIKRSDIPAVTHVDYSARIQTVHKNTNLKYYNLIKKFKEITNCPVLVNTSFNIRGEPIVNTPENAFNCFMGTELDKLVIGNFILEKEKQDQNLKKDYSSKFELD